MLTRESFQFPRQAGASQTVAHLVDYFRGGVAIRQIISQLAPNDARDV